MTVTEGRAHGPILELIESYRGPPMDATRAVGYGYRALLARAAERLPLSARGHHRVLRVARTLADLEGAPTVARRHLAGIDIPLAASGLCGVPSAIQAIST